MTSPMTRPEIAALADKLVFAAENTQGCLYSQRKMLKEAADALRLSATSPGDAVLVTDEMVKTALISLHKNPVSWEHPNTVRAALEAALAPAENAGSANVSQPIHNPVLRAGCETQHADVERGVPEDHFSFREFREDAFRSMEVQICGKTKTVQFCCSDHGGDHPTEPSVALPFAEVKNLIEFIQSAAQGGGTKGGEA